MLFWPCRPWVLGFMCVLGGCDAGSTSPGAKALGPEVSARGCALDSGVVANITPGGYYTNGTTVCTADGNPHLFHGVDRPSLEWNPRGEWANQFGIPRSDFQAMADWHANVVRIALNQDFWLAGATLYQSSYADTVHQAVEDAEAVGLDVILDLHWSDRGDLSASIAGQGQGQAGHADQQQMADVNSKQFWIEVATQYQGDGHVVFELYNEPHGISWDVWLHGSTAGDYQVVGMQELYDAVRSTGANNLVIAGGLNWAFDLSQVSTSPIQGYNVMYASHAYYPQDPQSSWPNMFGYLATHDIAPVIATEFGDGTSNCAGTWDTALTQYADQNNISWTAWAWWTGGCGFPSLISNWQYAPTVQGEAIRAALMNYPWTPPGDAGDASDAGDAGGEAGLGD